MGSFLEDLEKIKTPIFWFTLFDLIFLISPGMLMIFHFYHDFFVNTDIFKLSLLAASFISPFVIVEAIIVGIMFEKSGAINNDKENVKIFLYFTLAILISSIIFYLVLFMSYLLLWPLKTFICLLVFGEVMIFLVSVVLVIVAKNSRKKT